MSNIFTNDILYISNIALIIVSLLFASFLILRWEYLRKYLRPIAILGLLVVAILSIVNGYLQLSRMIGTIYP